MAYETSVRNDAGGTVRKKVTAWWENNRLALILCLVTLTAWEIHSQYISRGDFYFPSPRYVVAQTVQNSDVVLSGFVVTITEVLGGFAVALILGIPLGILLAEVFTIRQSVLPIIVYVYSLPQAIVAPLFILWFGAGKVGIMIFVGVFGVFPIVINTITGFNQQDPEYGMLGEQIGASRWQSVKKIRFWTAFPNIVAGIKITVQGSVIGTIIAEFIATDGGLGYLLQIASGTARDGMMFGILFLIGLFAILFFKTVSLVLDWITAQLHLRSVV